MIQFGLLTAILDGWSYEDAVNVAAEMNFQCLEVACWPVGKAERRYAGVSHIDGERVLKDDAYARHVLHCVASKGMHISSLAYYPNPMDADLEKRELMLPSVRSGQEPRCDILCRDRFTDLEHLIIGRRDFQLQFLK